MSAEVEWILRVLNRPDRAALEADLERVQEGVALRLRSGQASSAPTAYEAALVLLLRVARLCIAQPREGWRMTFERAVTIARSLQRSTLATDERR